MFSDLAILASSKEKTQRPRCMLFFINKTISLATVAPHGTARPEDLQIQQRKYFSIKMNYVVN